MVNLKKEIDAIENCDFSDTEWKKVVENVVLSYNLNETETEQLKKAPVAQLLAALPYYAGCKNPELMAVLKVNMYVAGVRNKNFFMHRKNQSIRERLLPGVDCPAGDQAVIELITSFLELISINDHLADFEEDLITGHSNPIGSNALFYYNRKEYLIREIESYPDQELVQKLKKIADPIKLDWWGS